MRKSTRARKSVIPDYYKVYLTVEETDIGDEDDPISVAEVMHAISEHYKKEIDDGRWALKHVRNGVWT